MGVQFAGNILASSEGQPLPISMGGTGQSTAPTAINALLPVQTNNSGKILVTNGANVSWSSVTMSPGGSDTQIQFNDAGSFGGSASLVINKTTGAITSTSTLTNTGLTISNSDELNRVLTFQTLGSDRWYLRANNIVETGANSGSDFEFVRVSDNGATTNQVYSVSRATGVVDFKTTPTVNGSAISSTSAASALTGTTLASNVVSSSLTSVGTLTNLTVTNTIAGSISGNAATATTAGTVTTASQPNITSVGTLAHLTVTNPISGSVTGSAATAGSATTAGTVTTASQPNITSVGTLTSLGVTGTVTAGAFAGPLTGAVTGNASTATLATSSTNLAGGDIGYVPYQTASGATGFLNAGTSGYILTSNGTGVAPVWAANAGIAYPANEIVYGTGTGSSSYTSLTYDPTSYTLTVGGAGTAFVESSAGQLLKMVSDTGVVITVGTTDYLSIDTTGAYTLNGSVGTAGQVFASAGSGAAAGWTSAPAISITGNAATVTHGVYTTDTGTVTNTMLAGSISNAKLSNSSITVGTTGIALGGATTSLSGLVSIAATTFTGALTGAASSNLLLTGGSMTGTITLDGTHTVTGLPTPANGTDAVNKNYVDAAIAGLSWKIAVKTSTTANITLSGTQTIDGIALVANDRILVKNQSTTSQNGIYVVASSAWSRATDSVTAAEINGEAVYVQQGTVNANTAWTETATVTTVGTDPITYAQFSGGSSYTAGTGISLAGNTISNTGVTSIVAGTGITISGSTGAVTINSTASGAASALTGTALASNVVSSSLTSVGTLTNLTVTNPISGSITGNAGSVTNGVYTTDSGTVTNTMLVGSISNAKLANSSVNVNGTSISLGASGTITSAAGTLTGTTLASNVVTSSLTTVGAGVNDGTYTLGWLTVPQNSQGTYTLVLADSGKHIFTSTGGYTWTIPANSSVSYPIGSAVTFVNQSAVPCTISCNDTMYLGGSGSTGNRTLGAYGFATAMKTTATTWIISGTSLT